MQVLERGGVLFPQRSRAVSPPQQASVRNRLLGRLSHEDFALVGPYLQRVRTELRQTLITPHEPVTRLFFPEVGYASITVERAEGKIEVGLIGREGLVGASPILLDSGTTPHHEFVQCPGEMFAIDATAFTAAVDRSPTLRKLLLRYIQTKLVQARQAAYVNASHNMEARLARWILMCHDRSEGNEIPVTHEFIAMMLGVQRSGATIAVQVLEGGRLIKAKRGRITVQDRAGLIRLARGSYGATEAEYARLIEGPGQSGAPAKGQADPAAP